MAASFFAGWKPALPGPSWRHLFLGAPPSWRHLYLGAPPSWRHLFFAGWKPALPGRSVNTSQRPPGFNRNIIGDKLAGSVAAGAIHAACMRAAGRNDDRCSAGLARAGIVNRLRTITTHCINSRIRSIDCHKVQQPQLSFIKSPRKSPIESSWGKRTSDMKTVFDRPSLISENFVWRLLLKAER